MCQMLSRTIGVKNEKYVTPTFQGRACCFAGMICMQIAVVKCDKHTQCVSSLWMNMPKECN